MSRCSVLHGVAGTRVVTPSVALSLPEMILLRRVLKPKLIATDVGVVYRVSATGLLFNASRQCDSGAYPKPVERVCGHHGSGTDKGTPRTERRLVRAR
jgi:hypothetical protein